MKPDSLSAEEICKIIEACAKRRVVKLKLGTLELEFEPRPPLIPPLASGPALPEAPATVLAEQTQEENKSLLKDEATLRDEQLAELQLTDPAEYERLLLAGRIELEEDDGPSQDN